MFGVQGVLVQMVLVGYLDIGEVCGVGYGYFCVQQGDFVNLFVQFFGFGYGIQLVCWVLVEVYVGEWVVFYWFVDGVIKQGVLFMVDVLVLECGIVYYYQ